MTPKFLLSMPTEQDVDYVLHTETPSFLIKVERNDEGEPLLNAEAIVRWYAAGSAESAVIEPIFEEIREFLDEEYDFISDEDDWTE